VNPPRAVFFDMDGTLLDWRSGMEETWRAVCAAGCADLPELGEGGADRLHEAVVAAREHFWADPQQARWGRMDLLAASRTIVGQALSALGMDAPGAAAAIATDFRARRDAGIAPFPGALELLAALRAAGTRLALITNGAAGYQRRNIDRFDLAPRFDCVIVEGEFGVGKPDERVFHHALAACGVAPGETWMVGDDLVFDVLTPVRLGMHAVWIDPTGAGLPEAAPARPHRIVRAVHELAAPLGLPP
jgi:putative hydrolase of the HAD superfamily